MANGQLARTFLYTNYSSYRLGLVLGFVIRIVLFTFRVLFH